MAAVFTTVAAAFAFFAVTALAAVAFVDLDGRVDTDKLAGISPKLDAGELDAVGGTTTAGNVAVPWTVFEKQTSGEQQIFSRAFNGTDWVTKGHGTVNGASSGSPQFLSSLNFDQNKEGEAPSIDFAGTNRAVPWATWYEPDTDPFGHEEIFASRFDATQDKWVFAGQGRPGDGDPPVLNIRTDKDAENPEVAGGNAAGVTTSPGPWIVWQEKGPSRNQIFVVKPIGPGTVTCPAGTKPAGGAPVGGFCWQQVGVERSPIGNPDEPSLNVDPSRAGIEPDIVFAGTNDAVPWAVWYEVKDGQFGVTNERVFAAKAVTPPPDTSGTVDGGFVWEAVGNGTTAPQILDTSGTNQAGPCLESKSAENACTLNRKAKEDAEDPKVAAGTMNPANPTVPWVVWAEDQKGISRIFASRLVGGTHFELANGGKALSSKKGDAGNPDITFAKNTPYVSYRQDIGGTEKLFVGHFENPADPTFVRDTNGISRSPEGLTLEVAPPISSDCTANPFNGDGSACQGGAPGKAFFLFNDGPSGARKIFGKSYP